MTDSNTVPNPAINAAPKFNTHDVNEVAGAMFFVVGRGTEGGAASYRISVAGVTDSHWGELGKVAQNSGYSFGTIQVDLGERGNWAVGAATAAPLKAEEKSYVDAIVDEASQYAKVHNLKFTEDKTQLRADLLSHANSQRQVGAGKHRHPDPNTPIQFLDNDTHNSINAWAGSSEGQQWIHKNIDYPQVKNIAQMAMDTVDTYGSKITEDHRLETMAILAKAANQFPGHLEAYKAVLKNGGDYDAVLRQANAFNADNGVVHDHRAAAVAKQYQQALNDPTQAAPLLRAHAKVADPGFDPSKAPQDPDFSAALKAVGQHVQPTIDVKGLQTKLTELGYTAPESKPLTASGRLDADTKHAVQAFQKDNHLHIDGKPTRATRKAVDERLVEHRQIEQLRASPQFQQAKAQLEQRDDEQCRRHDPRLDNAAGAMAVAAYKKDMTSIDHISVDRRDKHGHNSTLQVVQGEPHTAKAQYVETDINMALNTPLLTSAKNYEHQKQINYSHEGHGHEVNTTTHGQQEDISMQKMRDEGLGPHTPTMREADQQSLEKMKAEGLAPASTSSPGALGDEHKNKGEEKLTQYELGSILDLVTRMGDAALANDIPSMRAVNQEYMRSTDYQQFQQQTQTLMQAQDLAHNRPNSKPWPSSSKIHKPRAPCACKPKE